MIITFFITTILQEEKEIQLHSAHRKLSSENISRDTTCKPDRAKLGLQHDRISLQAPSSKMSIKYGRKDFIP